eukprot:TRINITY_DN12989_c0_g1_i1.p1 TRINITY_DN12989_c0_g1~~TRINITY_DN12989_c0_g1_i1.p1  ORF type:complete len:1783 (+),score=317.30 TRINITY_DN12989_c0_g1_i1:157-5505(+)
MSQIASGDDNTLPPISPTGDSLLSSTGYYDSAADQQQAVGREKPYGRLAFDGVESRALRAVQAWWSPLEASIKRRYPEKLTEALKVAHGGIYLKTVKAVRRSSSLRTVERHELEMDMAARLVQVRSVLGKWEAGLGEVRSARKARDPDKLQEYLAKYAFSEEDPEIAAAWQDLRRWQTMERTLPAMLEEAVKSRDINRIKDGLTQLGDGGPAKVQGLDVAQKILTRYLLQAKKLKDAIRRGDAPVIEAKLQDWRFDGDDVAVIDAKHVLWERDNHKRGLRAAIDAREGALLQQLITTWRFERTDHDLADAKRVYDAYSSAAADLRRLMRSRDLAALSDAILRWEFCETDMVLQEAKRALTTYEARIRAAITASDGWTLQSLWTAGTGGRALLRSAGELHQDASEFRKRYMSNVMNLRQVLQFSPSAEPDSDTVLYLGSTTYGPGGDDDERRLLLRSWPFHQDDPNLEGLLMCLQIRQQFRSRELDALREACASGCMNALQAALARAKAVARPDCPEILKAAQQRASCNRALEVCGTMAFGVTLEQLREARNRADVLDKAARRIREVAAQISASALTELRSISHPHSAVHGVMEIILNLLAGINPNVKNVPLDTHWRSIQRMLTDVKVFLTNLTHMPEYLASGQTTSVGRARQVAMRIEAEVSELSRMQGSATLGQTPHSLAGGSTVGAGALTHTLVRAELAQKADMVASQLLEYAERVFEYADVLQLAEHRAESIAAGLLPPGDGGLDAWGRKSTPTPVNSRPASRSSARRSTTPVQGSDRIWRSNESPTRPSSRASPSPTPRERVGSGRATPVCGLDATPGLPERPGSVASASAPDNKASELNAIGVRETQRSEIMSDRMTNSLLEARNSMWGNGLLAAAWIILGFDAKDGEAGLEAAQERAMAKRASALISELVLSSPALRPDILPPGPGEASVGRAQTAPAGTSAGFRRSRPQAKPRLDVQERSGRALQSGHSSASTVLPQVSKSQVLLSEDFPEGGMPPVQEADAAEADGADADGLGLPSLMTLGEDTTVGGEIGEASHGRAVEEGMGMEPDANMRPQTSPATATGRSSLLQGKLILTIKEMPADRILGQVNTDAGASGAELKAQAAKLDSSTSAKQMRLQIGSVIIRDHAPLTTSRVTTGETILMTRTCKSLPALLEATVTAVATSCGTADLDASGPSARPVGEPALLFLHGTTGDTGASSSPPGTSGSNQALHTSRSTGLRQNMIEVLKAALDALRAASALDANRKFTTRPSLNCTASRAAFLTRPPTSPSEGTRQLRATLSSAGSALPSSPARPVSSSAPRAARRAQTSPLQPSTLRRPNAQAPTGAPDHSSLQQPNIKFVLEPTRLTAGVIKALQVPLTNIAAARHALRLAGDAAPAPASAQAAVAKFVQVMEMFYFDFVLQRAFWSSTVQVDAEAAEALRCTQLARSIASSLKRMADPTDCHDLEGVLAITDSAAAQIALLATHGLTLPAVHIEYVRQAMDSVGRKLLASPPKPEPEERLRWADQAMAIQRAPLPRFGNTLAEMSLSICPDALRKLGEQLKTPEPEAIRLLAAAIWVVDSSCRCDISWPDAQARLADSHGFVSVLSNWSPVRDGNSRRLARARELLLGSWDWVAAGCGGNMVLSTLFAWTCLAVTLLPMVEMAQRIQPVHRAVTKGIERIDKAVADQVAPEQLESIKARAWTSALFLLDSDDEPWWWLQLIRPTVRMDPPWMDCEDGGVDAPPPTEAEKLAQAEEEQQVQEAEDVSALAEAADVDLTPEDNIQAYIDRELGRA